MSCSETCGRVYRVHWRHPSKEFVTVMTLSVSIRIIMTLGIMLRRNWSDPFTRTSNHFIYVYLHKFMLFVVCFICVWYIYLSSVWLKFAWITSQLGTVPYTKVFILLYGLTSQYSHSASMLQGIWDGYKKRCGFV